MKHFFLRLINPVQWIKAYRFHRANSKYDKSSYDLELFLYSKILKNDMLHYGYFDDVNVETETISIRQFEDAQIKYVSNIINQIKNTEGLMLDVGCGMGGLSGMLLEKNYNVEALTPNSNQKQHIDNKYTGLLCHHMKFEDYNTDKKYDTIINSESLQYINLDTAFAHVDKLLNSGGRWIIADYFRTGENATNLSGHKLEDFKEKIKSKGWNLVYEQDISLNVLPTIKFAYAFANRFLLPIKHFAFEKLRYKLGWLYYMGYNLHTSINKKIEKEMCAIDPEIFLHDKKYFLFTIEKV